MGCGNVQNASQPTTVTEQEPKNDNTKKESTGKIGPLQGKPGLQLPPIGQKSDQPPPKQIQLDLDEKRDNLRMDKKVTEQYMIQDINLELHGGNEMNPQSIEFISDSQIHVSVPKDVEVNVKAQTNGPLRLVAINSDIFPYNGPISNLIIADSQEQMDEVSIVITSPALQGFILFIASQGQNVKVKIDAGGKFILSLSHVYPLP